MRLEITVTVLDCTREVRHGNRGDSHFEDDLLITVTVH